MRHNELNGWLWNSEDDTYTTNTPIGNIVVDSKNKQITVNVITRKGRLVRNKDELVSSIKIVYKTEDSSKISKLIKILNGQLNGGGYSDVIKQLTKTSTLQHNNFIIECYTDWYLDSLSKDTHGVNLGDIGNAVLVYVCMVSVSELDLDLEEFLMTEPSKANLLPFIKYDFDIRSLGA